MATNLPGQLNDAFSFNNTFFQSGDFTQFAAGANGASLQPGYNYLDYSPVGAKNVAFEVPLNPARKYVVGDVRGAVVGGASPSIVISGAAGAGYKFNGADAVSVSGAYLMKTVLQTSGVNFNVF